MNGTTQDAESGDAETQVVESDWEKRGEPSTALVTAIADARGVDATELQPLYEIVDADALDALFAGSDGVESFRLSFEYEGFSVTISGDGRIELVDTDGES